MSMTVMRRVSFLSIVLAALTAGLPGAAKAVEPAANADIADKTVYLIPNSWLRYGPSLLSRLYTQNKLAMEIKGRGKCTFFACPVTHNTVELYARRSRLDLAKPTGTVVTERSLRLGDEGEDVRNAQKALAKAGYKVEADAKFGKSTQTAVEELQRKSGIEVDGAIGPKTRDKLAI